MPVLDPAQIPYLIVLAAAVVVGIVVIAFRRYRKPIDKADPE
jgi:hypothetical protein